MAEAKKDANPYQGTEQNKGQKVQTSLVQKGHKTVWHLQQMKEKGQKITMVGTAAMDSIFGMYCEVGGADLIRYTGQGSNIEERAASMMAQARNYKKMAPTCCTNMNLQPCQYVTKEIAAQNVTRLIYEGCDSALLMGVPVETVRYLSDLYMAEIGHVGVMSGTQTNWFGGYKKVGKTAEDAMKIFRMAYEYQEAGMKGMTIEMTPREVTAAIAKKLKVPVIQVAGSAPADGSEMVCYDLWGMIPGTGTMHAKSYGGAKIAEICIKGVAEFKAEIEAEKYPAEENGWGMDPAEAEKFLNEIEKF
jgi:3-methyl-2-oxobutanoate hydroxymethyltransferase